MVRTSNPFRGISRTAVAKSDSEVRAISLDAVAFGADGKSLGNQIDEINRVIIANGERPSDINYRVVNMSSYWWMYEKMDRYRREVSILSTIISRSTTEIFRYGIGFEPKFATKCEHCGHESQVMMTECPVCRSHRIRAPDPQQKNYFRRPNGRSFIDEANDNGQPLIDVLKGFAESQYLNNQGYILCVTGELLNEEDKALIKAYPLEFMSLDARNVRYLYDETGKPGTRYAFTRGNRKVLVDMEDPELDEMYNADNFETSDGDILYPAIWKVGSNPGATGDYLVYSNDEVFQDHWMRPALTYGIPVWFDIDDDLLAYHFIEKHNLKKYQFGYVRKIVVLPGFNDDDAASMAKGIKDVLSTNDNSIPIVTLPPQIPGTAEMKAQVLELGTESSSDLIMIKDDIRSRVCAHVGVPDLITGDVESSGGMNNESQQITIYDRYLMDKYNRADMACRWVQSWFPEITDWELCVIRPSKAYTDSKRRMDRIQEAQLMKQLGFDIYYIDGEFRYSEEPVDQVQRKQQEQMQAMAGAGMGEGLADGGMIPGDGEGPPEKGTARREDPEVGETEDEIDLAKREMQGALNV